MTGDLHVRGGRLEVDTEALRALHHALNAWEVRLAEATLFLERAMADAASLSLPPQGIRSTLELREISPGVRGSCAQLRSLSQGLHIAAGNYEAVETTARERFSLVSDQKIHDYPFTPDLVFRRESFKERSDFSPDAETLMRRIEEGYEVNNSIVVERITRPDGTTAWAVFLPGLQDLNPFPELKNMDPFRGKNTHDPHACIEAYFDVQNDLMLASHAALKDAGATPDEPVLLAGHSLGGMTAARLSADPGFRNRFNVAGVFTAGSPVGQMAIPPDVPALSLEHDVDPVAWLDFKDNQARAHHVTVLKGHPTETALVASTLTWHSLLSLAKPLRSVASAIYTLGKIMPTHDAPRYTQTAREVDRRRKLAPTDRPQFHGWSAMMERIAPPGSTTRTSRQTTERVPGILGFSLRQASFPTEEPFTPPRTLNKVSRETRPGAP